MISKFTTSNESKNGNAFFTENYEFRTLVGMLHRVLTVASAKLSGLTKIRLGRWNFFT